MVVLIFRKTAVACVILLKYINMKNKNLYRDYFPFVTDYRSILTAFLKSAVNAFGLSRRVCVSFLQSE